MMLMDDGLGMSRGAIDGGDNNNDTAQVLVRLLVATRALRRPESPPFEALGRQVSLNPSRLEFSKG